MVDVAAMRRVVETVMGQLLENMTADLSSHVSWASLYLSIAIYIEFLMWLSGDGENAVL